MKEIQTIFGFDSLKNMKFDILFKLIKKGAKNSKFFIFGVFQRGQMKKPRTLF